MQLSRTRNDYINIPNNKKKGNIKQQTAGCESACSITQSRPQATLTVVLLSLIQNVIYGMFFSLQSFHFL